jgi:hypothetical protein
MNLFPNIHAVSPTNTVPPLPNVEPCKPVPKASQTKKVTSFMLSPPTNSFQASPPIGTYMMRLQTNFGAISQTNGRETQVQRTHFSPQNQKKQNNHRKKDLEKLSFRHIQTKLTSPS